MVSDLDELIDLKHRSSSPIKDGPAPQGECTNCGMKKEYDIFFFRGRKLCGDCRYKARTGKWPCRNSGGGTPFSVRSDDATPGQEIAIRSLEECCE